MKKKLSAVIACLLLSACAEHFVDYQAYLDRRGVVAPATAGFQHCHGYGCQFIADVTLDEAEWKDIEKSFKPKPKNAEKERQALARAIGVFETKVGAITGTHVDHSGTFEKMGHYQLDCVDESTNSTVYLALLEQKGLMRFHSTQAPTVRLPFQTGRWPHQTAVIVEKENGALFAVDSWFHGNGFSAEIMPLNVWKDGWNPAQRHDSLEKVK